MAMEEGMKKMVGSPGTRSGVALRVSQCVFATACFCAISVFYILDLDSFDTAFWVSVCFIIMRTMMVVQIQWSLVLAGLAIYAIRKKEDLHERTAVILLVVVDGIMAVLTFTAASASAVVASTLYVGDVHFCRKVVCGQIVLSMVLAFIVSVLEATSALSMLALLASSSTDLASL